MSLAPEPAFRHGTQASTAVLLCNLGTPDEATPAAVRRYLAQFLSDPRVVEIPRLLWLALLHGVILRVRPARSARKYASIWTADGSPLKVWTEKQALLLRGYLGQRGQRVLVRHAMRYGQPSIASALDALKVEGADRVLVLPLYPQYAASTTASTGDAVAAWMKGVRNVPELRFVKHYHDDPAYIGALAKRVNDHWMMHGRPDKLVLSFHGVPRRTLALGDPYHCECLKTGRLLGERLKLRADAMLVTFQSRFGKAEWLKPYTEPTLVALAKAGTGRVDVMCPGFAADCLETLEEIADEAKSTFLRAGGKEFYYIPVANDTEAFVGALATIAREQLVGLLPEPWDREKMQREKDESAARARAMGATQ